MEKVTQLTIAVILASCSLAYAQQAQTWRLAVTRTGNGFLRMNRDGICWLLQNLSSL